LGQEVDKSGSDDSDFRLNVFSEQGYDAGQMADCSTSLWGNKAQRRCPFNVCNMTGWLGYIRAVVDDSYDSI